MSETDRIFSEVGDRISARVGVLLAAERAAGRLAGLREAAEVARSPDHTLDWRARERIAASILALAEGKEG